MNPLNPFLVQSYFHIQNYFSVYATEYVQETKIITFLGQIGSSSQETSAGQWEISTLFPFVPKRPLCSVEQASNGY